MKNLKLITALICLNLFFTACSDDDDNGEATTPEQENEMIINGETYPLKAGALEYYGNEGNLHNTDIILITTTLNEDEEPEDEIFNSLHFELFTSVKNLEKGTYSFSFNESAGTFSDFSDIRIMTGNAGDITTINYEMTGGEITVLNTNPYEFSFEGSAQNYDDETDEVEFSGYYKGDLYEFDYNDEGRPLPATEEKSIFSFKNK